MADVENVRAFSVEDIVGETVSQGVLAIVALDVDVGRKAQRIVCSELEMSFANHLHGWTKLQRFSMLGFAQSPKTKAGERVERDIGAGYGEVRILVELIADTQRLRRVFQIGDHEIRNLTAISLDCGKSFADLGPIGLGHTAKEHA